MPQIKIKTVHIQKLKKLDIYDKWLSNVKNQWEDWSCYGSMQKTNYWNLFINLSFNWNDTPEGQAFWSDISVK